MVAPGMFEILGQLGIALMVVQSGLSLKRTNVNWTFAKRTLRIAVTGVLASIGSSWGEALPTLLIPTLADSRV